MTTPKEELVLYAMALMAWRLEPREDDPSVQEYRLRIVPGIVLALPNNPDDAAARCQEALLDSFPIEDEWTHHQAVAEEVPAEIAFEKYTFRYQVA